MMYSFIICAVHVLGFGLFEWKWFLVDGRRRRSRHREIKPNAKTFLNFSIPLNGAHLCCVCINIRCMYKIRIIWKRNDGA